MSQKAATIFPGKPAEIIVSYIIHLCGIGNKPKIVEGGEYQNDRILGLDSVQLENFLKGVKTGKMQPLEEDDFRPLSGGRFPCFSFSNLTL
jgi:hypothetical protein